MLTETVSAEFARQLEFAEIHAWADQWDSFPVDLKRQYRLSQI